MRTTQEIQAIDAILRLPSKLERIAVALEKIAAIAEQAAVEDKGPSTSDSR